ncbi:MAG TPA: hypothetical protein VH518_06820, partial [Tepidisphaeraceae bacterium]
MSRLDDHVSAVQNKLALGRFVQALAWGCLAFAGVVLLAVAVNILFQLHPPKPLLWLYGGAGVTALVAMIYAATKRPGAREAAVAIDEKLGLQEKISTALYIRPSDDPFAQAAVRDAEETARGVSVNLRQHFPIAFPKPAYGAIAVALVALLTYWAINPMSLFGREEKKRALEHQQEQIAQSRKTVEKAIASINEIQQKTGDNSAAIKL